MNPDLEKRITELETQMRSLRAVAEVDPQVARMISKTVLKPSSAAVSSYDKLVIEAGSGSYNVADVPDGFYETDEGKLIPYYTP